MALIDNKITNADYNAKDISSLSDRPSRDGMSASQLKERFDTIAKTIVAPKFNDLIDDLVVEFAGKAPSVHTHDDRYYTEAETISLLEGKAPSVHTHDDRYYTEAETIALLNGKEDKYNLIAGSNIVINMAGDNVTINATGELNVSASTIDINDIGNYFTEVNVENVLQEVGVSLLNKAPTVHTHDDRYFTEAEVNALLNGKAPTVHTHPMSQITDYQEGTWEPVLRGHNSAGVGTYTNQLGRYTKIGNIVTFSINIVWTAHTGTGPMIIPLPFQSAVTQAFTIVPVNITFSNTLSAVVSAGMSNLVLYTFSSNNSLGTVYMGTNGELIISGSYMV